MKNLSNCNNKALSSKERRNREIRRRMALMIFTLIAFITFSIIFIGSKSVASDGTQSECYKHYMTLKINANDTLSSIADTYCCNECIRKCDYINEVKFMNGIEDEDLLYEGNYIVVPYYDSAM